MPDLKAQWWSFEYKGQLEVEFCLKISSRKIVFFQFDFYWLSNGSSKIRHHFWRQSISQTKVIKNGNNKNHLPKLIFLKEKQSQKIYLIQRFFGIELKSQKNLKTYFWSRIYFQLTVVLQTPPLRSSYCLLTKFWSRSNWNYKEAWLDIAIHQIRINSRVILEQILMKLVQGVNNMEDKVCIVNRAATTLDANFPLA